MKRAMCAVIVLAACGKKTDPGKSVEGSGAGAQGSSLYAGGEGEPTEPPPAPTIKAGKGDCKTEYAPRPTRDPNPMCKVEGGTFEMSGFNARMSVKLSPYYIDQFEVTNAQVVHYLNATKAETCKEPSDSRYPCFRVGKGHEGEPTMAIFVAKDKDGRYYTPPGTERLPFTKASQQGAREYCAWAGKILPTEPMWEFAARRDPETGKDLLYPWGDEFDGRRARCDQEYCPDAPVHAPDSADRYPVPVGTYDGTNGHADGRSPWGVFDMAGNAEELVADCDYAYKPCDGGSCLDPPPRVEPQCRPLQRGGGIEGQRQLRTINRDTGDSAGFRCARIGR